MKKVIILLFIVCTQVVSQHYIWQPMNTQTTNDLNYIGTVFPGAYAVGNNGTFLRYDDADSTWKSYYTGVTNDLRCIEGKSTGTLYAAGSGGTVIKSTNYGLNWITLNTGTTADLNSILYYASNSIIIVGDNGTYLKTSNGGTNWTNSTISSNNLYNIRRAFDFWITGSNGTFLRSSDAGFNWTQVNINTTSDLNFMSEFVPLLLCGDNSTLFSSTDMGNNWIPITTGFGGNYLSTQNWVISTEDGKIISLSDYYGNTWVAELDTNGAINSISSNLLYACGTAGRIYKRIFIPIVTTKYIDCNTIRTPFRNNGSFNRDPATGNSGFEWPKGSNMFAEYASGIWLGAVVEGDTLIAMAEYDYEYLPGFTDKLGNPQAKNDTNYRVYRLDYEINNWDRTRWPNILLGNSNQGAPVYFDNPTNSWRPLDIGSQTMFMSFTDSYPESHNNNAGSTAPLKADIKMLNFANGGPSGPLAHTIFTQYTIINRSNKVWNNFYISLWTDDDLGESGDDAEGCDTNLQLGYVYNYDNSDGAYGSAPPAFGFLLLKGLTVYTGNQNDTASHCINKTKIFKPEYRNLRMSSYNRYENASPINGDPLHYRETYRYLQCLMRDGSPVINPLTNQPTKFWYSGDPVTGQGWISNRPGNNRFMVSMGPLNVNPGDTQIIVFAQVIARGTSNINSITVLREYAQEVRDYYNSCYTSVPIGIEPVSQNIPDRFELYQNYPNPFNPRTTIKFTVPMDSRLRLKAGGNDNVVLNIYNPLGQLIETQSITSLQAGLHEYEFDGSNFASGVYFYSLIVGDNIIDTKKMLLLK